MTAEQLAQLQDFGGVLFLFCLAVAALHLILGLLRPGLVWRKGRGGVVLMSLGLGVLGFLTYAGIVAYTHSHPNGPHAFQGYLDDYVAEQCAKGADLPACRNKAAAK
jgi:hypothetical protein